METPKATEEPRIIYQINRARSGFQADIWLVKYDQKECVMRDYSNRPWYQRMLCRYIVRREIRTHEYLKGIEGIPQLIAVLDAYRYLIEYIDGIPLNKLNADPGGRFTKELIALLRRIHKQGIAHGDFRNQNIMIGPGGRPYLIDFSTATPDTFLTRPLFNFLKKLDRRRLMKTLALYHPQELQDKDLAELNRAPMWERIGKYYRYKIYPKLRGRTPK